MVIEGEVEKSAIAEHAWSQHHSILRKETFPTILNNLSMGEDDAGTDRTTWLSLLVSFQNWKYPQGCRSVSKLMVVFLDM